MINIPEDESPKLEKISTMKFCCLTFLFGFCGGGISFMFFSWYYTVFKIDNVKLPEASDAIAIANTYIVYTTLIVTVLAIFLALATYYFSIQQAKSRKYLEHELLRNLLIQCKKDKKIGATLITELIENRKAVEKFEDLHGEKIRELIESYMAQYNSMGSTTVQEDEPFTRIEGVRGKIKKPSVPKSEKPK